MQNLCWFLNICLASGEKEQMPFSDNRKMTDITTTITKKNLRRRNNGRGTIGTICPPNSDVYSDYMDLIHRLPDDDTPSTLFLAANIDRSWQKIVSALTIRSLAKLDSPSGGMGISNMQVWLEHLTPILNLWRSLHQGLSLLQFKMSALPVLDETDPLPTCVSRQFVMGVRLVHRIHKALAAITKATKTAHSPDGSSVRIAGALLNNRCPTDWSRSWSGFSDPREYLRAVVSKTSALQKLLNKKILESTIDLADFFYPEAVFMALKQLTARKSNVALDDLSLHCTWEQTTKRNDVSCDIINVLVEGGVFRGSRLVAADELSPSVSATPLLTIRFIKKNLADSSAGVYLPFYRNSCRQEFIVNLRVECDGAQNDWDKTGAAFFCA